MIFERHVFASFVLTILVGVSSHQGPLPSSALLAAESSVRQAETVVAEALHREIYGMQGERDRLLEQAARLAPEFGPAHWHRGLVRSGSDWKSATVAISESELSPKEKEYLLRRADLKDDFDAHLKMADWCREEKLVDQERAHLSQAMFFNPDEPGIRERLGFQNVNGKWLTKPEAEAALHRAQCEAQALVNYRTKLREIGKGLRHSQESRRHAAREELRAIRDPYAFPAMENVLSLSSEECALAVVDAIAAQSGQEATDSLVRHAIYSQWTLVREAAADKLSSRPRESFVPEMIAAMALPMSTQTTWEIAPNGRYQYRHLIQRENIDSRDVLVLEAEYERQVRRGGLARETLARAFVDSMIGVAQREVAVAQANEVQIAANRRLTDTLNLATRQQLPADPQLWWQWWDRENDVQRIGLKQTQVRRQVRQISVTDQATDLDPRFVARQNSPRQCECFAAGTPVVTRHGSKPIEQVLVGDLVLSQDPESGELTFKPVLGTTRRPPEKLVRVVVGEQSFETSQGHLFWESGEGWRRADRLRGGAMLHGLRGSHSVSDIEEAPEAPTYNLVVADFNTYFVGKEPILSHDVTNRRPTTTIVPGLRSDR